MPPTGDPAHNPGMCPDQESNWWLFGSQASTQSTEPHQPGLSSFVCVCVFCLYDVLSFALDFKADTKENENNLCSIVVECCYSLGEGYPTQWRKYQGWKEVTQRMRWQLGNMPPFPFKTKPDYQGFYWQPCGPLICEMKLFNKWYQFSQFLPPFTQFYKWEIRELSSLMPPYTTPAHPVVYFSVTLTSANFSAPYGYGPGLILLDPVVSSKECPNPCLDLSVPFSSLQICFCCFPRHIPSTALGIKP